MCAVKQDYKYRNLNKDAINLTVGFKPILMRLKNLQ